MCYLVCIQVGTLEVSLSNTRSFRNADPDSVFGGNIPNFDPLATRNSLNSTDLQPKIDYLKVNKTIRL